MSSSEDGFLDPNASDDEVMAASGDSDFEDTPHEDKPQSHKNEQVHSLDAESGHRQEETSSSGSQSHPTEARAGRAEGDV
jgi:hypothetical protein